MIIAKCRMVRYAVKSRYILHRECTWPRFKVIQLAEHACTCMNEDYKRTFTFDHVFTSINGKRGSDDGNTVVSVIRISVAFESSMLHVKSHCVHGQ